MTSQLPLSTNPGFQRLWSARVISRFGSALGYVVLIWYVYAQTGSALAVVYVGLAEFVPTIAFGILSGALVIGTSAGGSSCFPHSGEVQRWGR